MTNSTSFTLAMAIATLTALSTHAQSFIAYDNSTSFQGSQTSRGSIEIGDEINLSGTTGSATVTQFEFEYFFNGVNGGAGGNANGVVRFYAKDFTGTLQPGGDAKPGTLLFESAPFALENGFNHGTIPNLSVTTPDKFIWTVQFSGLTGNVTTGENPGLLFYNGVGQGDGPGQSRDDHWERDPGNLVDWVLVDNAGLVDNFGARVTATPEPTTIALALGGAAALAIAARRRKA
jgi:uncharacterized protein (TIGR03382 family)